MGLGPQFAGFTACFTGTTVKILAQKGLEHCGVLAARHASCVLTLLVLHGFSSNTHTTQTRACASRLYWLYQ